METKKKYLIIAVIAVIVISLVGTFAWLVVKTKKSSLVLVLGDYESLQVTLSPYELDITADPVLDYISMPKFVSITASNAKAEPDNFNLFYQIEQIDSELASTSMKYTITRSTNNGSTFTEYASGNFSGATNDMTKNILEETLPAKTTYYYRVYTYLDGNAGNQSALQGKTLNTMISANLDPVPDYANYSVGTNYFETLEEANAACSTVCTIKVEQDVYDSSNVTIASGKTVTLDTNGKNLTFTDSLTSGSQITNNGTLIISGNGKITSSLAKYVVLNNVELTIEDTVTIENTYSPASVYDIYAVCNNTEANLTMTGGTLTGVSRGLENKGTANISGGTIIGGNAVFNYDYLEISGTANIIGNSQGGTGISNDGRTYGTPATLVMTGGTVEGGNLGIYMFYSSTATITGGTVIGTNYEGIHNYAGAVTIGSLDSSLNNSSPVLIGASYGYYGSNCDTSVNLYNGIMKAKYNYAMYTSCGSTTYRDGYNLTNSTEQVNGVMYNTAYLIAQ